MSSSNVNGITKDSNGSYSKVANAAAQNKTTFSQKMAERKSEEEAAQK